MIQITARPITTRSEARSPWTKRRSVACGRRGARRSRAGRVAVARRRAAHRRPSSLVAVSSPLPPAPVIAATTLLGRLFGLEVAGRPAEAQHEDPVGDLEDVGEVVADHDHAEAALAQPLDQLQHLAVCATPSAAVGSSSSTTFGSPSSERATATCWRWPPESVPTSVRTLGIVTASAREQLAGPVLHRSPRRAGARPRRRRARSPRARGTGWRRRRGCRRAPGPGRRSRSRARSRPGAGDRDRSRRRSGSSPASASGCPAIVLTSVDLPAPLSPTRPTTSPAWTSKSTPSSACTAPKRLLTPSSASSERRSRSSSRRSDAYEIPASLHALERRRRCRVRPAVMKSSSMTVSLDVVFGHRDRRRGSPTGTFVCAVVDFFWLIMSGGHVFALRRARRRSPPRPSASRLDRLVDGHVLLAGEDPLHAGDRRVLAGGRARRGVDAGRLHRRDRAAGRCRRWPRRRRRTRCCRAP